VRFHFAPFIYIHTSIAAAFSYIYEPCVLVIVHCCCSRSYYLSGSGWSSTPHTHTHTMAAEQHVRTLLLGLGEDVNREGLVDTPKVCEWRESKQGGQPFNALQVGLLLLSAPAPPLAAFLGCSVLPPLTSPPLFLQLRPLSALQRRSRICFEDIPSLWLGECCVGAGKEEGAGPRLSSQKKHKTPRKMLPRLSRHAPPTHSIMLATRMTVQCARDRAVQRADRQQRRRQRRPRRAGAGARH
jgi:hypothetical protein